MSHSETVQTRRRKQKALKERMRIAKEAKRQKKQKTKG